MPPVEKKENVEKHLQFEPPPYVGTTRGCQVIKFSAIWSKAFLLEYETSK